MAVKLQPDFSSPKVSGASASLKPAPAKSVQGAKAPAPKPSPKPTPAPAPKSSGGSSGGSQAKVNGGWYNGVQYWDPGQGPQTSGGDSGGGGGEPNYESEISEMYAPAIEATYAAERYANEEYGADTKNLEGQFANQANKYNQEQTELLGNTDTEEQKFNKVLESAYAEAVRAYNALQQQGRARFGRGNSAGQAIGELAQQEYFRQQGKVQERGVEGAQQFAAERNRVKMYVKQKMDDLEQYKLQAMSELKKNLNDRLLEIQMRRGDIEANKTRDRLAILQDALNQTRAIQAADKSFRQNLALSAVSKMQEISGRAFTPQEIVATMAEFEGALSGVNVGAASYGGGQTALKRPGQGEDEFSGLNVVQGGGRVG